MNIKENNPPSPGGAPPALGIIAEYNPYHNGHRYQLHRAKEVTSAAYAIIVLSGNFTQRGEPASFSKWERAKMALSDGADLVLELPNLFASASAEGFAYGAVQLLAATGVVKYLAFGAETDDLPLLKQLAAIYEEEPAPFQAALKEGLAFGLSFPQARMQALIKTGSLPQNSTAALSPNNILAIEYLRALKKLQSPILPVLIKRRQAGYHDTAVRADASFASATAIRTQLRETPAALSRLHTVMPEQSLSIMQNAIASGLGPVWPDYLGPLLQYRLRTGNPEELSAVLDMEQGLWNRMQAAASSHYSLEDLLSAVQTKRYPQTRIMRIFLYCLLNRTQKDYTYYKNQKTSPYLRVLGFQKRAVPLLSAIKAHGHAPLLTSLKYAPRLLSPDGLRLLQMEETATDLYAMGFPASEKRQTGLEYRMPVVVADKIFPSPGM